MAAALDTPVEVMDSAGEGGAWGIALLAAYMNEKEDGETLEAFLDKKVFSGRTGLRAEPDEKDRKGFEAFMERYMRGLPVERCAAETLA
jgi:sugar (pentulose or hexulose) kinase